MGNDQSSPSGSVSARNPKTSVGSQAQSDRAVGPQMRCVRSAQSTPRLGDPPPVPPVAYHHQKSSDSLLDGRFPCGGADSSRESSTPQHRLSTDDNGGVGHSALERRPSRGKMALSATQSTTLKDAQHARRIEKAASQFATTGDFGLSLAEQLKLSHHHINLLVQTWPRLHGSQSIFLEVFKTLMKSNNAAREIFQKMSIVEGFTSAGGKKSCDLKEHARLLAELFDYCIKNMQRPAKL
uniref:Uncharacterized protein n=1 Tax=Plectus sambesii TaxID=2011161 RepID=A0A914URK7_9BILA